jgi:hypothetical protein
VLEDILTLENIKDWVGVELGPVVCPVDRAAIDAFTEAIGDNNPRWQMEAPPTMVLVLAFDRIQQLLTSNEALTVLHGSSELEPLKPVMLGDAITASFKIDNVRERQGEKGVTCFTSFAVECFNQQGEEVARCRQLAIVSGVQE